MEASGLRLDPRGLPPVALRSFSLASCLLLTDISALGGCRRLERVSLSVCGRVSNISALAGCAGRSPRYPSRGPPPHGSNFNGGDDGAQFVLPVRFYSQR